MSIKNGGSEFEFTYQTYRTMLDRLKAEEYNFRHYGGRIEENDILLRHDVDWSPQKALRMAQIEAKHNISSTYFFLLSCPIYNIFSRKNQNIIREIEELGHEVGLHFSTKEYWEEDSNPPPAAIESQVKHDQEIFESCVSSNALSSAVSFHMPPDWVLNEQFDGFVNVYEKRLLDDIGYVADSRQRWREEVPFADGFPEKEQLLVHPGSWGETDASFATRIQDDLETHCERYRELFQQEYRVEFNGN
jgi:peptidoglycan/xylan/chitin deacetylase (PgdA/CDA1 family)